jgi:TetR/AcrR family transcriptional regulator, ethionamide resistance regulator
MQGRARRDRPAASPGGSERDVRETILAATEALLGDVRFADLSVADILTRAGVSRTSFYFYFASKHQVLAELARRAVGEGHTAGGPWLSRRGDADDHLSTLRDGITAGARLWSAHAPVLRAIVENWREDETLTSLWSELMDSYTDAAVLRIEQDQHAGLARVTSTHSRHVAAALTWLGERLYYLAAIGQPPFDDSEVLVDTLFELWSATLYGPEPDPSTGSHSAITRRRRPEDDQAGQFGDEGS